MKGNDFGWALAQMRSGQKVRRPSWREEKGWVTINKRGSREEIVNEDGSPSLWRDNAAILAKDWELAE